jgi:aminopeptidase
MDARIIRMAKTIVAYSLGIRSGDLLRIEATPLAQPLALAVTSEALRAGAHVMPRIALEGMGEMLLREASDEQLKFVPESERRENETMTARLAIGGTWNTWSLSGVDPKRLALQRQARSELFARLMERKARGELRTCITQYPTNADAQLAEMSLDEYEDFVFGSCFCDRDDPIAEWRRLSAQQAGIVEQLNRVKRLRVEASDTNLEFSVEGRNWINSDGKANFPSGEVFSAPVEDSVQGTIHFEFPAIMSGRRVNDIRLRLENGRVVAASAGSGDEFLQAMLATDEGATRLGEVAFGTNPGIQRFTHNILFDEKIGGTMHFALGAAYPECGGRNKSAIHWDMIKDMRSEGRVWADGILLYERGKFF